MDRAELVEEAKKLQDMYRADIGPGIEDDLISFRAFYRNDLRQPYLSKRDPEVHCWAILQGPHNCPALAPGDPGYLSFSWEIIFETKAHY